MLDNKAFGGNITLKFDIKKAFDTLDWGFLLKVLKAFGFHNQFCNWISTILHSARLSFIVNGNSIGYFSCKRGVRLGDPLSPLLFCLAEDVLSRGITHLVSSNLLKPMSSSKGCQTPSHVLYADDVMVLCKGSKRNLSNLLALFAEYAYTSGQCLSIGKCRFYAGGMNSSRVQQLKNMLGLPPGSLPLTYLGVPMFKGKPRVTHLQPIADRIKAKLSAWKGSLLSLMGRVQLVNSVISGMLLYSFHIYARPISLIKTVDGWIKNFIWSGDVNSKKLVTVAWHTVCSPRDNGGLGLRSIRQTNDAALLKLS